MSDPDEKKARLEAIRAANRAKKEAQGGDASAAAQPATSSAVVAAEVAAPAAGAASPDDKKARLEAIRAANRAGGAGATAGTATPAAAAAPAAAARPATPATPARPAARTAVAQPTARDYLLRAALGAIAAVIICVGLATMTGHYLTAAIFGLLVGSATGILVGSWPPTETTGD